MANVDVLKVQRDQLQHDLDQYKLKLGDLNTPVSRGCIESYQRKIAEHDKKIAVEETSLKNPNA